MSAARTLLSAEMPLITQSADTAWSTGRPRVSDRISGISANEPTAHTVADSDAARIAR